MLTWSLQLRGAAEASNVLPPGTSPCSPERAAFHTLAKAALGDSDL